MTLDAGHRLPFPSVPGRRTALGRLVLPLAAWGLPTDRKSVV